MVTIKVHICYFCDLCKRVGTQKFNVYWCDNKQDFVKPTQLGCNLWNERKTFLIKWIKNKI